MFASKSSRPFQAQLLFLSNPRSGLSEAIISPTLQQRHNAMWDFKTSNWPLDTANVKLVMGSPPSPQSKTPQADLRGSFLPALSPVAQM